MDTRESLIKEMTGAKLNDALAAFFVDRAMKLPAPKPKATIPRSNCSVTIGVNLPGLEDCQLELDLLYTPVTPATWEQPAEGGEFDIESLTLMDPHGAPLETPKWLEDALIEYASNEASDTVSEKAGEAYGEDDREYEYYRD